MPRILCQEYRKLPGARRCQHYLDNGSCKLDHRFMCEEWQRINGYEPDVPDHIPDKHRGFDDDRGRETRESLDDEHHHRSLRKSRWRKHGKRKLYRQIQVNDEDPRFHYNSQDVLVLDYELGSKKRVRTSSKEIELTINGISTTLVGSYSPGPRPEITYSDAELILKVLQEIPEAELSAVMRPYKE